MDKKAIIQELCAWNDTVLAAQVRPFLEPFGPMRFDADVFDEDERQDTGCIALYKGGNVFRKDAGRTGALSPSTPRRSAT